MRRGALGYPGALRNFGCVSLGSSRLIVLLFGIYSPCRSENEQRLSRVRGIKDPKIVLRYAPMSNPRHICRIGSFEYESDETPIPSEARRHIQPWLSAIYQSEHLAVLIGSGLTTGIAYAAGRRATGMEQITLGSEFDDAIAARARLSAER